MRYIIAYQMTNFMLQIFQVLTELSISEVFQAPLWRIQAFPTPPRSATFPAGTARASKYTESYQHVSNVANDRSESKLLPDERTVALVVFENIEYPLESGYAEVCATSVVSSR